LILYITINGVCKTLGYTSDIGSNKVHNYFVGDFEPIIEYCNVIICESTYGNKPDVKVGKKERKNDLEKLKSIIDTQIRDMKGRVVIPSFAQSRCQQLALLIYQMYKDNTEFQPKVYIDSPLAIQIFKEYQELLTGEEKELYDEMMNWDKLKFVKESVDSKALVESDEPCVILTTNGMATIGRVLNHLRKCVPNPNTTVLFAGYSSDNSLATLLKNKDTKKVTINGVECTCKCSIYSMKSFSGHAMFNQLLEYYSDLRTDKIVLHHGQEEAKLYLKSALEKELEKKCKSTRVVVANSSLKFSL
jgi:metallo-beta-lactamase family protein